MATLVMMCGIPGSGKSTFLANNASRDDIVVSRDEIRFSMVAEDEPYFSKENEVVKTFYDEINKALAVPDVEVVYADATFLTPKARRDLISHVYTPADQIIVFFFDTPLMDCIRRNGQRHGRACIPRDVVIDMYNRLTVPSLDKERYLDGITYLDKYGHYAGRSEKRG